MIFISYVTMTAVLCLPLFIQPVFNFIFMIILIIIIMFPLFYTQFMPTSSESSSFFSF